LTASFIAWGLKPHSHNSDLRLYAHLFADAHPDSDCKDFLHNLNTDSLKVMTACVAPSLTHAQTDPELQFEQLERFEYFMADQLNPATGTILVFNPVTELKDSWAK
jgi:hypothetical protein